MQPFTMTPAVLAAIAGAVLSLAFSYIPGLNTAFAEWKTESKQLFMAGLLLAVALAVYGLGCAGIVQAGITCDQQGAIQLVWVYISAIMANQGVFQLTPKTNAVKIINAGPQL